MLRLNVDTNRKIGQPDYGSAGASCNLELELDTTLFQDLDGFSRSFAGPMPRATKP